jgi:hypothetical protein
MASKRASRAARDRQRRLRSHRHAVDALLSTEQERHDTIFHSGERLSALTLPVGGGVMLFLAFAVIALLRLSKDVRRMRERKRSASPFGSEYQISGHPVARAPRRRPLTVEPLTDIGSLSKWPSLRRSPNGFMFAMVFAAEAAFAGFEAVRRSL